MKYIQCLIGIVSCLMIQCSASDNAVDIGMNISGVVDSAYSVSKKVFYVLNSDFDNSYKTGSILAISNEGKKLFALEVPRMGKALKIVDDKVIGLFEGENEDKKPQLRIYGIEENASLKLVKSFEGSIDCRPNNLVVAPLYEYYAVSCSDGSLFVGDKGGNFLNKVRNYKSSHRGMFIDKSSGLIFSFPSGVDVRYVKDFLSEDKCSYSEELNGCDLQLGSNEIPDEFEKNKIVVNKYKDAVRKYQVGIYSINQELSKPQEERFQYKEIDTQTAKVELKFIYDNEEGQKKKYKTGFWDTVLSETDGQAYISRRVLNVGEIIKINIKKNSVTESDKLQDILEFEQIQSNSSIDERSGYSQSTFFPGKLILCEISGKNYLVANHFRDFVYFPSKESRLFGYSVFDLNQKQSLTGVVSKDIHESYYSLSINEEGKGLSGAFYGNQLIPIVIGQEGIGLGWEELKRIN